MTTPDLFSPEEEPQKPESTPAQEKPAEKAPPVNAEYGADDITVLKGLEAVRKRPAMYIGDLSKRGLHHLIYEVVDNSVDESMAGFCDKITVTLHEDGSCSVTDNGRGIPVAINKQEGVPAIELVMTVLHAGGKFDKDAYKISGGLHGVGVSVVNALSEYCIVTVHRDGEIHQQEYKIGQIQSPLKVIGKTKTNGTTVRFTPDSTIFRTTNFEFEIVEERLRAVPWVWGVSMRGAARRTNSAPS